MHGELPKLDRPKSKGRVRRVLASLLVVVAAAGALYYVFTSHAPQQQRRSRFAAQGPVPVLVAAAKTADVPVYLEAVGTVKALNTVTVRPQADGKLIAVKFKEGQDVKKGDLLARIDPTTYQAALDQTLAKKAQDEAQLANAKNDMVRYEKLAANNAINKQQADTQKALVAQYSALVQSDQASIENARALLGYTTVTAPIDGRTGMRQVDEGNIVHASDANSAIVVITEIKPISVLFNLPQQDLTQVNTAFAKGPLSVEAQRSDTNAVLDRGTLTVVDNQVDPSTGTVKLKAEFPNANVQLWPGQFVNVRLLINTLKDVVVIPTGAVQRGPNGTFVYVIDDQNKAALRPITVSKQDEAQAVVSKGVTPPERVVTIGFARLTDGARVSISGGAGTPPAATPPGGNPRVGQRPAGDGARAGERRRRNGGSGRPNAPQ